MSTNKFSAKDITRSWHLIDAKDKILGRLAADAAKVLMGKHKATYVPYLDLGDNVVITNAAKVKVSGKKETDKIYMRHSGYPGGARVETLAQMRQTNPERIITHAISGMLPKSKLGRQMIKKLHVFAGNEHTFKKQVQNSKEVTGDK